MNFWTEHVRAVDSDQFAGTTPQLFGLIAIIGMDSHFGQLS
jgi:hypothetical protein